tara:strand:+ start:2753 stop:2857 length:105 start_codon:yes stop_codon:yes gene_type:complete
MADKQQQTITIDCTAYTVADLSENANLQVTDAEI